MRLKISDLERSIPWNTLGVYILYNSVNGKFYVGSGRVRNRLSGHRNKLRANKHKNQHLQNAWNQYGEEAFLFLLIEDIPDENMLEEREQFWMDLTQCYQREFGYNKTDKADRRGISYISRQKIKESNTGRKHTEDALQTIRKNALKGKDHPFWGRKIPEEKKMKGEKHPNWGKTASEELRKKMSDSGNQPVVRLSLGGEILERFDSGLHAGQSYGNPSSIGQACRNPEKIFMGFKWAFATSNYPKIQEGESKLSWGQPVVRLSNDGVILERFESISKAAVVYGNMTGIAKVCKNKHRTSNGNRWAYATSKVEF